MLKSPDSFTEKLLSWFEENARELPWRKKRNPYSVWISEIMLQQTVVKTVIPYFRKWMNEYPDIETLSKAKETDVLSMWEGLGYYSRAVNILKTAKLLMEKHSGKLPGEIKALMSLPGIGKYTASAILSIAYGRPVPVMDANVRRIMQRRFGIVRLNGKEQKRLHEFLESVIPSACPGDFNEAMMELGQRICLTRNPECLRCPLHNDCSAFQENRQNEIPETRTSKIIKKESSALVCLKEDAVLLTYRKKGLFKNLWLIPNIPKSKDSDIEAKNVRRYMEETLSCDYTVEGRLRPRTHYYTQYADRLFPLILRIKRCKQDLSSEFKWVNANKLENYPVPSKYRSILKDLQKLMNNRPQRRE